MQPQHEGNAAAGSFAQSRLNASRMEQDMPDIMHLIKIHASPERVYQTLATAEGIRNWYKMYFRFSRRF
jgi:hypothetical protein